MPFVNYQKSNLVFLIYLKQVQIVFLSLINLFSFFPCLKLYFLIPNDNNSDLYFLTTNKSSVRDENKDKFKLYYYNDFGSKTLDEIIGNATANPMKRERCINGKAEIFGYYYDNLDKDIYIKISYNKIKGDGILGPILSLSILFVLLIIVVVIFIKNTYYDSGYRSKRSTISSKG